MMHLSTNLLTLCQQDLVQDGINMAIFGVNSQGF